MFKCLNVTEMLTISIGRNSIALLIRFTFQSEHQMIFSMSFVGLHHILFSNCCFTVCNPSLCGIVYLRVRKTQSWGIKRTKRRTNRKQQLLLQLRLSVVWRCLQSWGHCIAEMKTDNRINPHRVVVESCTQHMIQQSSL